MSFSMEMVTLLSVPTHALRCPGLATTQEWRRVACGGGEGLQQPPQLPRCPCSYNQQLAHGIQGPSPRSGEACPFCITLGSGAVSAIDKLQNFSPVTSLL